MYKKLLSILLLSSTFSSAFAFDRLNNIQINELLSNKNRPTEDLEKDPIRKPAKIIHFTDIAKGDVVIDLFAGGGWYTELFSMAVGPNGKVYAQNDNVIWQFAKKGLTERTKNNRLENVTRLDKIEIADMAMADKSVDLVFTALNYHDMFFTHRINDGKVIQVREQVVDHKKALANIKRILKDDGQIVIIDHVALAGSGFNAPNDIHRIDPNIVKYQMQEAGFELVEEAFYLRNSHDDLNTSVFAPSTRGKTDRFVYKFKKLKE
ncbi:class I SAM-dependent methyltransferase [Colwellia sp. RE-S-Sl-9]